MERKTTNFDDVGFLGYIQRFEILPLPEAREVLKAYIKKDLHHLIDLMFFPPELVSPSNTARVYYYYIHGYKTVAAQYYNGVGDYLEKRDVGFIEPDDGAIIETPGQ